MGRVPSNLIACIGVALCLGSAQASVELEFVPETAAHGSASRAYRAIWEEDGERILAALESRSCLPLAEPRVTALIADGTSHSGGPAHPMQLRATYPDDVKRATLVHELGHRHLWQLAERLEDLDGHKTLFLILDRVWADVWGEEFAAARIEGESTWEAEYDYAAAWRWARSLTEAERTRLWNELLAMNGRPGGCNGASATPIPAETRPGHRTERAAVEFGGAGR